MTNVKYNLQMTNKIEVVFFIRICIFRLTENLNQQI